MNWTSPKIKLIILILLSPIFSFLYENNSAVLEWAEMGYMMGMPADFASHQDEDTSNKDFSVYQLSVHAVQQASTAGTVWMSVPAELKPCASNSLDYLMALSEAAFLTAHHFQASYLQRPRQQFSLSRHLLWEVFLI